MLMFNIHDAKTNLSQLITRAVAGESFIIAKAGKPQVLVTRLDAPATQVTRRLGFLPGQFDVPDDFDRMGDADIAAQFNGDA